MPDSIDKLSTPEFSFDFRKNIVALEKLIALVDADACAIIGRFNSVHAMLDASLPTDKISTYNNKTIPDPIFEQAMSQDVATCVHLKSRLDDKHVKSFQESVLHSLGLTDALVMKLYERDGWEYAIAFYRNTQSGGFLPQHTQNLLKVRDALVDAANRYGRDQRIKRNLSTLDSILGRLPQAMWVVDDSLRIIWRNKTAAAIFDGPEKTKEVIETYVDGKASLSGITAGVRHCIRTNSEVSLILMLRSGMKCPIQISPLDDTLVYGSPDIDGPTCICLVQARPNMEVTKSMVEAIMSSLGLTKKEAQVSISISRGLSPDEVGQKHEMSTETVRWHLRQIYQKTHANSQSKLADLVSRCISLVK